MKTWRWTLFMVAGGALAFACNGEETTEDDTVGPTTSTGGSTTTTTTSSTATSSSTGGPMSCYDENSALNAPGDQTLVGLAHCTAMQITGLLDACASMTSTAETCMAFETANQECWDCIFAVDMTGNSDGSTPVLNVFQNAAMETLAVVSVAACESVAQGQAQCGPILTDFIFCIQTACGACEDAEFGACATEAQAGICSMAAGAVTPECQMVLDTADATPSPQCDGADFAETYTNVATYFCGPMMP